MTSFLNSTDHKQQQRVIHARKILVLDYPFWGNLALRLALKEDPFCPTMWTNGKDLGYNPNWTETLSDLGLLAICAHEVAHCMCCHHLRRGKRNPKLWNIACDHTVNSIIIKAGFDPPNPMYDPRFDGMSTDEVYAILEKEYEEKRKEKRKSKKGGQSGKSQRNNEDDGTNDSASGGDSTMDDEQDNGDAGDGNNPSDNGNSDEEDREGDDGDLENDDDSEDEDEGNGDNENKSDDDNSDDDNSDDDNSDDDNSDDNNSNDDDIPDTDGEVRDYPGKDGTSPKPADLKEQEQDWKIATVQAATQAKSYGNMPAGLDAEIQELVEPKVDPRELLQNFVAMSAKNDFSWFPPNRKYIQQGLYLPSPKSEELGTVVQVLDTSISVSQVELDQFASIVSATLEAYTMDVIVLYCDTRVYEPQYFKKEDLPLKLKMKGRGGTNFEKPFTWVKENEIEPVCLLYLTDLECNSFPRFTPDYPVIWICTNPPEKLYYGEPPFGEVIHIDLSEEIRKRRR